MSLHNTVSGNRVHIGFFGRRNAGKSSLVNAVTGQNLAVVSAVPGTTTDPVQKAMELLPMGPVLIIDTPGIDDEGALGALRVQKTQQVLHKTDVAVLVVDASVGKSDTDEELIALFREQGIPFLVAYNKCDLLCRPPEAPEGERAVFLSAQHKTNIDTLKESIAALSAPEDKRPIVGDLLQRGDLAILVTPIDSAAPKGRLILPQHQTIRDVLDSGAGAVVVKETELSHMLSCLAQTPRIVITDSQAFAPVAAIVPEDIPLTSFSILFVRHKGDLIQAVRGAAALETVQDGDAILISEGCTHHRQCDDIGSVKLPRWIRGHTGKELRFVFSSGTEFPEDLSPYRLIVHCGGCMLNPRQMRYRQKCAAEQGVPMTNYGVLIAHIQGILPRALAPFPAAAAALTAGRL